MKFKEVALKSKKNATSRRNIRWIATLNLIEKKINTLSHQKAKLLIKQLAGEGTKRMSVELTVRQKQCLLNLQHYIASNERIIKDFEFQNCYEIEFILSMKFRICRDVAELYIKVQWKALGNEEATRSWIPYKRASAGRLVKNCLDALRDSTFRIFDFIDTTPLTIEDLSCDDFGIKSTAIPREMIEGPSEIQDKDE